MQCMASRGVTFIDIHFFNAPFPSPKQTLAGVSKLFRPIPPSPVRFCDLLLTSSVSTRSLLRTLFVTPVFLLEPDHLPHHHHFFTRYSVFRAWWSYSLPYPTQPGGNWYPTTSTFSL